MRSVFRYAFDAEVLDKPVRTGPGFRKPSAKTLRLNHAKSGPRMFEADEIRVLLDNANANGKAMVLLGVNGALGNTDIALLPTKAVDLEHQWLDYPREKTGVPRRIPLWPETVARSGTLLPRGSHRTTRPIRTSSSSGRAVIPMSASTEGIESRR